uniref:Uncharacterized protein n=1 Tax=Anguilla anguilla TaxID=7936 RepID=A0A0E9RJ73_ANGAN
MNDTMLSFYEKLNFLGLHRVPQHYLEYPPYPSLYNNTEQSELCL